MLLQNSEMVVDHAGIQNVYPSVWIHYVSTACSINVIYTNVSVVHSDRGTIRSQKCRKHKDSVSFLPDLPISPSPEDASCPSTSSPPETKLQLKKCIKNRDPKKITVSWKIPFRIQVFRINKWKMLIKRKNFRMTIFIYL